MSHCRNNTRKVHDNNRIFFPGSLNIFQVESLKPIALLIRKLFLSLSLVMQNKKKFLLFVVFLNWGECFFRGGKRQNAKISSGFFY